MSEEKLAIEGGTPARNRPLVRGKKVGDEELQELSDVIASGELYRWSGVKVKQFEERFAELYGAKHAVASTSGTASLHVGVGMVNPSPGDEIITAPITDIGTVIPILYQTAIPVFAEVDRETFNLDPESVEKNITPKTKAILPVHLFGSPCDMDALLDIGRRHGIPVIEDCSQAHLARLDGNYVGSIGDIGCFSFQQSKHITTGDGGITITNNDDYGIRGKLFADKGWHRDEYGPRKYTVFGPNYRMTELQGAVMCAQLRKLEDVVGARRRNGDLLAELLADVEHIAVQKKMPGAECSYWLFGMRVLPDAPFTAGEFADALRAEGLAAAAHYIGKPIFLCHDAIRAQQLFGDSHFPFDHPAARPGITYDENTCPVTQEVLDNMVTHYISESYEEEDVHDIANGIRKVARLLKTR